LVASPVRRPIEVFLWKKRQASTTTQEAAMSTTEVHNAGGDAPAGKVDMHLEVEIIPVSDVDRSKGFYQRLGWRLDDDAAPLDGLRIVQRELARLVRRLHGGGAGRDGRARVTDSGFARGVKRPGQPKRVTLDGIAK
jgi:hypothetical protein